MRYIKLSEEEYWSVHLKLNAFTFYIITYGLHYLATFVLTITNQCIDCKTTVCSVTVDN